MKNILKNYNLSEFELVKKKPRLVIMLDFDDVLNCNLETLIEIWNKENNDNKTVEDCTSWDLSKTFDRDIFDIFKRKGFFRNLKPSKNAIETVKKLISNPRYEVYIVSSCGCIQEYAEKYEWIQEYIPEFKMSKFISCSEKQVIAADIIVDDNSENLVKCEPYMEIVAMSKPHNQEIMCRHIYDISEIIPIAEMMWRKKYYQD